MTRNRICLCLFVGAIAMLAHHATALAGAVYWDPAAGGNGHIYEYVGTSVGFEAARTAASARGVPDATGHLATIQDAEENAFLRQLAFPGSTKGNAWIGLSQPPGSTEPDGDFQWVTGEPLVYTNWSGSEPNDAGGNEDAAAMYDGGVWNDLDLGYGPSGYLVEYETSSALHSAATKLTLTSATTLSVQGVVAGTATGTAAIVPLLGTMNTQLYFNDLNQLFGILLIDSNAEMAAPLSGILELGVTGTLEFSLPNATAKVWQAQPAGSFSVIDAAGVAHADNVVLTLPTGTVTYSSVGGGATSSFNLSSFGTIGAANYAGPVIPVVTTFDSPTPGMRGVKLELPLLFDVPLLNDASVRIGLNLEAVGEFAIVPEPGSLLLAGSGLFVLAVFAGATRRIRQRNS